VVLAASVSFLPAVVVSPPVLICPAVVVVAPTTSVWFACLLQRWLQYGAAAMIWGWCHSPPIIPGALHRSSTSSSGSSPVIVVVTTPTTTILVDCQFFRLLFLCTSNHFLDSKGGSSGSSVIVVVTPTTPILVDCCQFFRLLVVYYSFFSISSCKILFAILIGFSITSRTRTARKDFAEFPTKEDTSISHPHHVLQRRSWC